VHLVEAARRACPRDLRGAGAVRVGEVGDGELALLGIAGVGVRQELSCQSHTVAERRVGAELVVQADLGDAVDVAQRFGEFEVGVVQQAPLEGVDDLALWRPVPRGPRTARMNGKPNFAL
jgi:hypothetical protein